MVTAMAERTDNTAYGGMQDKVRQVLLSSGQREVFLTVDDLVGKTNLNYSQVYQTLYRLQQIGELEILRDEIDGRMKVSGVRLNKMEESETIDSRVQEHSVVKQTDKELSSVAQGIPNTLAYLHQKTAVERARLEIIKSNAGLNPDEVIAFTPNPLGEEALSLLSRVQDLIKENRTISFDLEAERRNVGYYKQQAGVGLGDSGT